MSTRRTVLVVEDNDANFALMQRLLESTGLWTIVRATRVTEAEAELARGKPAAMLLDLDLPDTDGLTLARRVKADAALRDIPIVVVSASVMKQERDRAEAAGCEYFVEKPFDIDRLRSVVAEAAGPSPA
ncbi:putative response regulator/chemotaxis protein CheW [Plesiocystis pacifica SIR-1]|uniref:Putative response regulator/chemotaxis protein CheW n=1 Tax=Plesiocystis pacifica SIR-1 TaxID=391625 RepID=A6GA67_9BACT|nr:response regulator [Plesiocystis pacifica]EDM77280.1 putative response regulator/chemotaxis protein CheW [Plesiocystis pacifica SIR-1]